MSDRREYELNDQDHAAIMAASQPVPYLIVGGMGPRSPQENANAAWQRVAGRLGFDWLTVEKGRDARHVTAIPTEPS